MNPTLAATLIITTCACAAALLRAWPRLRVRNYGIDAFYYLISARELRKQKRVPVSFDHYIFDPGPQYYPPGFPLFISLFPQNLIVRFNWLVNPLLDALVCGGVGLGAWMITRNAAATAAAAATYALTPTLIQECTSMNSRVLGNALFCAVMLIYIRVLQRPDAAWIAALCISGVALLMTHKMSTQNFVFVALGLCVWQRSVWPLAWAGVVFASTLILTRGLYMKVFIGNIDILLFWRRNLQYLYAHMVYRSPVYGTGEEARSLAARDGSFFKPGLRGAAQNALRVIDQNFLALFFFYIAFLKYSEWNPFEQMLCEWATLTYAWAMLTTFAPPLRFMGEGIKYEKLAAPPMAWLVAAHIAAGAQPAHIAAAAACLLLNIIKIARIFGAVGGNIADMGDLAPITDFIKASPLEGTLTLPYGLSESIAYHTGRRVLWGAHSAGYKELEAFFPILRHRLEYYFDKYNLNFLVINLGYVVPRFLKLEKNFEHVLSTHRFALYRYKG